MKEENVIPITDTRLENALNAYVFILKNTLDTLIEAGSSISEQLEAEIIKAAMNIAFKYLSMETEIARAKEIQK